MTNNREQQAIQLLKQIIEPNLNNDIVSLGMVRNLRLVDDYVYLKLYIGSHQHDLKDKVEAALSTLDWCKKPYVQVCTIPGVRLTLAISSGKGGVGQIHHLGKSSNGIEFIWGKSRLARCGCLWS